MAAEASAWRLAKPLGIAVHDHIIVGKDGHARPILLPAPVEE